jgi:BirA family biotin operon repressor/biotin-[acetyl-CoA-carboxylase] ligase
LHLSDGGIDGIAPPFRVHAFETVGSTSTEAKSLAEAGSPHGTVVWAREQTAGRGRYSRAWSSPPGNFYGSIVLRPTVAAPRLAEMGFLAALAVAETAEHFLPSGPPAKLKWPNDVLLDGGKIAGILLEGQFLGSQIAFVVAGIGINVASKPESPGYPTASLHALGARHATAHSVLPVLLTRFGAWLDRWTEHGFSDIRAAWLHRAARLGQPITVRVGAEPIAGMFNGIDDTGALQLQTQDGPRRITAGEVAFG